jgi:monofunctional biosynthetic peptidoglycan transglycosylase
MARKSKIEKLRDKLLKRAKQVGRQFPRLANTMRWSWRLMIMVVLIDSGYMFAIWPDWKWYTHGEVPRSQFILKYEREQAQNPNLPRLRWKPVNIDDVPLTMLKAVLAAEDSRFFKHAGLDAEAFKSAMEYNWKRKRFVYGASTLSQQTVKNMFLSPSRNPMRKWHEVLLTYGMESHLSKMRILEIYLNVAEFGRGVYGIEAAAQKYFHRSASRLTRNQCIELAATLPAPVKHNPRTRTKFFLKHRLKIKRNMGLGSGRA